jgi:hypothetical protein
LARDGCSIASLPEEFVNNLSTTLIIAFVIYIAAFNQLGNYAKIATTSAWGGTPPSGTNAAGGSASTGSGSTLGTVGGAVSGVAGIIKAIPLIGSLF